MAKGKKTGGRDFQKGNKLGTGRPKLPEHIKQARKFNAIECTRVITEFFKMTMDQVELLSKDPETPSLERILAKMFLEAEKTGDTFRLNFLFDRSIGKVQNKIKVDMPKPTVIKLLDEDAAFVVGAMENDDEDENE